jgi:AraC-like DNA-binding protein
MSSLFPETHFLTNLWATPAEWAQEVFNCVVRAGHLKAGVAHRIERETYPGHEFILCLGGRGWVQVMGKRHEVEAGDVVWVNCHHPHAYGAVVRDPWEVYWVRTEGRELERLGKLAQVGSKPVFKMGDTQAHELALCFERVFKRMTGTRPSDAAACHAAVAEMVALLFQVRLNDPAGFRADIPDAIRDAMQHMRLYYSKPIRVGELARSVGMPESSFTRQFRKSVGTSPIAWLRHERIKQAKRRLMDSDDPIKEVARQVGYSDQYFFSKDFKKMTKLTPTQFREEER